MKGGRVVVFAVLVALGARSAASASTPASSASAAPPPWVARAEARQKKSLDEFDRRITDELRQLAPDAVDAFERANRAREADDHATAAPLFAEVMEKAPPFRHAERRLCSSLIALGKVDEGLGHCRHAAEDGGVENLAGLALALIDDKVANDARRREAAAIAERATDADPKDAFAWRARLMVAAALGDVGTLSSAAARLGELGEPELAAAALMGHAAELLSPEGRAPDSQESSHALRLASDAAKLLPREKQVWFMMCSAALGVGDQRSLDRCSRELQSLAPDDPQTHFLAALRAGAEGRLDDAQRSLDRARELGLDPETYADFDASIAEARPFYARWLPVIGWTVGGWLLGALLLIVAGLVASRAAMRSAESLPTEQSGRAQGMSAALARAYRGVLWLCCVYYYVSIPLLALTVIATGVAVIVGSFAVGYVPVKLLLIAAVLVLVTLGAILKSLFVRRRDEDPGQKLDTSEHPKLAETIREVAERVETRPVDTVFLTPGTEIAVFERGGMMSQVRGTSERCLVLGVGVLDGMQLGAFKAVLAHEYGHFSNRDTAGGGFALAVRRSLLAMAQALIEGGAAAWYNPAWLFLNGFHRIFLRISQGASRLQEVLADRWAAFAYGSDAFVSGLTHVIERSVRFDHHASATLQAAIEHNRPLRNLYEGTGEEAPEDVDEAIRQEMEREPSPYDSHPAPRDRIRWVRALGATADAATSPEAGEPAWSLFNDREQLELAMTAEIRYRIYDAHGVRIADAA